MMQVDTADPWPFPFPLWIFDEEPDPEEDDDQPETPQEAHAQMQDHTPAKLRLAVPSDIAPTATTAPRRYAATLMAAGPLLGHDLTISEMVLAKAAQLFSGVTALLDHPHDRAPQVDRIIGHYEHVVFETDRIVGELVLDPTPTAAAYQPLLDAAVNARQAGQPGPDIGLSANIYARTNDDRTAVEEILEVETVDIVFRPASQPARLEQILAHQQGVTLVDKPITPLAAAASTAEQPSTPAPATAIPAAPAADPLQQYKTRYADATLELSLQASSLPPASQQFIRGQLGGKSPDLTTIDAAIEAQRKLLADVAQETTIFGFGNPLDRGKRVMAMTAPMDEAKAIVNWMFGVKNAPLPEPSMRNPAEVYRALTGDHNWYGRFDKEHVMFAAANTTTLADLATDAMNKVMIDMWTGLGAYRWFEQIVTVQPNDGSLNDMKWLSFGGISTLPTVAEGAAYTELSLADAKEADSFIKYGGYIGVTEEMLRKSQLAKLQAVPRAMAIAAVRTRSAKIAAIFTQASGTGPTLDDDSAVLFYSTHGSNVQTTALSAAAWKAARLECFKMTEAGSSARLGFYPKFCLIPADLFDDALVYFGYGAGPGGYPGTGNNDVNPYAVTRDPSDPRPIPVVVPEWTDTNNWAYLVDPNLQPVLQISYAQAPGGGKHPEPELYSVASPTAGLIFTNDQLPVKVRDWFAYGVSTWRGIGKRNVT